MTANRISVLSNLMTSALPDLSSSSSSSFGRSFLAKSFFGQKLDEYLNHFMDIGVFPDNLNIPRKTLLQLPMLHSCAFLAFFQENHL